MWMLPARVAMAASQVRCQLGSLVGNAGCEEAGRGVCGVGEGLCARAWRAGEARDAPAAMAARARKDRRSWVIGIFWLCVVRSEEGIPIRRFRRTEKGMPQAKGYPLSP